MGETLVAHQSTEWDEVEVPRSEEGEGESMSTPIQIKWSEEDDLDQVCFTSMATTIVMGALAQIRGWDLEELSDEEIEDIRVESDLISQHLANAGMLWAPQSYEEFNKVFNGLTTHLGKNLNEVTA